MASFFKRAPAAPTHPVSYSTCKAGKTQEKFHYPKPRFPLQNSAESDNRFMKVKC